MDYIPSSALTTEKMQDRDTLERVLDMVKRCHRDIPSHIRGATLVFWVFHVIRDYAATLEEGNSQYTDLLPKLLRDSDQLQLASGQHDIIFGHNDLLPANFLDDGDRLWLIDWEYAGFNSPLFDLGGLASNNSLDNKTQRWMLENYYEESLTDSLWHRYSAMKCASLLRETMWSMVSEIHSTIDFDYNHYTEENMSRYEAGMAEFRQL